MSLAAPTGYRTIAVGIATGALGAAMLLGSAAIAVADPPPNCTTADLAGISAGVAAATSTYLFTHPDVNEFFTGLRGQERDAMRENVQNYLNANPDVKADLDGIRQPVVDFKDRCQ
ncbi:MULTISPECIES: heme-binding protein [Mycobacterium]|nr:MULTISPECIES: heme-binding protein [Mycobacterium]ULL12620.1 hemophore-related protein [Mycobacterium liflandii]AGC61307.1 exported protein [Mycobacterium liflandii 128FXT]MDC8973389.1 heme-binding protein [Mycobacterium marinum]MDC8981336.1 heme-binding protein [Mycobacterium marinum]MDC8994318.1 heme-binding protein [Mycobacterium marinum]